MTTENIDLTRCPFCEAEDTFTYWEEEATFSRTSFDIVDGKVVANEDEWKSMEGSGNILDRFLECSECHAAIKVGADMTPMPGSLRLLLKEKALRAAQH